MEALLYILGIILMVVVGLPLGLILLMFAVYFVILILYAVVMFIFGIAAIPLAVIEKIINKKTEEDM